MNKTLNTIIFLLAGTIVSLLIFVGLIFIPFILLALFFGKIITDPGVWAIIFMALFAGSFLGAFFIYNMLLNFVRKKIDLEKYIHPILSGKKR